MIHGNELMLLDYLCSWTSVKKFFFKKKYRKSMFSLFIAIKFQKVLELSLILK